MKPTKAGRYVVELTPGDIRQLASDRGVVIFANQIIAPVEPQQSEAESCVDRVFARRPDYDLKTTTWFYELMSAIKQDIRNELKGGVG